MRWLGALFSFFYEIIAGCNHSRVTRPFTINDETYEVCLTCGHRVYYSGFLMRRLSSREARRMRMARERTASALPSSIDTQVTGRAPKSAA